MAKISKNIPPQEVLDQIQETFFGTIAEIKDPKVLRRFLQDLITPTELIMLAKRLMVAFMLQRGFAASSICTALKMSRSTVHEVQRVLWRSGAGYAAAFRIFEDKHSSRFMRELEKWLEVLNLPMRGSKKDMARWRQAMNKVVA